MSRHQGAQVGIPGVVDPNVRIPRMTDVFVPLGLKMVATRGIKVTTGPLLYKDKVGIDVADRRAHALRDSVHQGFFGGFDTYNATLVSVSLISIWTGGTKRGARTGCPWAPMVVLVGKSAHCSSMRRLDSNPVGVMCLHKPDAWVRTSFCHGKKLTHGTLSNVERISTTGLLLAVAWFPKRGW
jgi:hypothetical protein